MVDEVECVVRRRHVALYRTLRRRFHRTQANAGRTSGKNGPEFPPARMADLLDVVRKACLPAIWSQGVKLARANAVLADKSSAEERTFRVKAQGLAVAPTVTLYLKEQ